MTITLLFGVHAHQPVGNFPSVIEDAHQRCYGMFLRVLEKYPEFRFSVHFSGWLFDVLRARFPEDMARLARMTACGQVEWFGSGDCEPVLASIPHRDRLSQIQTLTQKLELHVKQRPHGAWLTERVWESAVVPSLVEAGIRYVVVDDYHFLCAGVPPEALDSFYTTEENSQRLDLFPISEALRYRLPFSKPADAVRYLEDLARRGQKAAIYFDDIEKFGIWPETYSWVYEQGWLEQFIEGVLASPLIRTSTYAEYHAHQGIATRGMVYLPTTSYIEMNEWTLPPAAAREYVTLVGQEKSSGHYEQRKAFLRGGIWRNFLMRYPEANWMHKRMLHLSERFAALPAEHALHSPEIQELLHRAQANDAYWHGLFGGIYLPHLRRSNWKYLLMLEAELDRAAPREALEHRDLDYNGHVEHFMHNAELQTVIREDGDASVIELSSYTSFHNFADTLRRYVESYHAKIEFAPEAASAELGLHHAPGETRHAPDTEQSDHAPASAHDLLACKHLINSTDVEPDTRPRGLFIETLVEANGERHPITGYHLLRANASGLTFRASCGSGGHIEKIYKLNGPTLSVRYRGTGLEKYAIEIQLNLSMPSCDGYGGRYRLADGSTPCGFGQDLDLEYQREIVLEDAELHGCVALRFDRPITVKARPHFTVSQSEAGFEKIMQAACVSLVWQPVPQQFGSHAWPGSQGSGWGGGVISDESLGITLTVTAAG